MKSRVLGIAWLVVAVALTTVAVLTWTHQVDSTHDRYSRALIRSRELDARMGEEVAKCRLGVVNQYDGLVRLSDQLDALDRELQRVPAFLDAAQRGRLEARLADWREAMRLKRDLIEAFKSEHSALRNSIHAFPHIADRVVASLEGDPSDAGLRRIVQRLEHDVMLLLVSSDADKVEQARQALDAFRERAPCSGSIECPDRPWLGSIAGHAGVIIDRKRRLDGMVDDILSPAVASRAMALFDEYASSHAAAAHASRALWIATFVLALVMLIVGAAYIIVRLQGSTRALKDTTGRLELAMEELRKERDRDKELAQLKSRFVSMTSHEFRTPLSVILSSADLLEAYGERWPRDKREAHLSHVQNAARQMSRMLDGVLLIGRAEAGMLQLNPQPLDLRAFCDAMVDETRAVAGPARRIDYVNEAPEGEVCMDDKLLRHVLGNLLSNAIKYSPEGSTVRFEVHPNDRGIAFDVSDEGIGIPPEDRPRLFEAFHRASNAAELPGTGLGLAVVKKSLEIHGGSIEVESELGVGTRFHVTIPCGGGA